MRKIITLGIMLLFIGMTIAPTSGIDLRKQPMGITLGRDTLYVGGSGSGNYSKIQDAINDSSDGDTVYVYDDSSPYYECVQINNSITLIGEDRNTTVIDANGGGVGFFIMSDNVSIHEFTIQNSKEWAIDIDECFGFCNISDNIITDNTAGITIIESCNNTIEDNTFYDNEDWGVDIFLNSNNNTVSGNTFEHSPGTYHYIGISIGKSTGNNISENIVNNHDYGISLSESDYNLVLNNIISSNYWTGIDISEGSNNTIIGNTIRFTMQGEGILIVTVDSKDNIIYHNNLLYNYENALDKGNNTWDDGKYGNYWSDYRQKYPFARKLRKEGIWDTPYEVPSEPTRANNYDTCPLIKQWSDSFSKTVQNNENVWLFRWLERFPFLRDILNVLGEFIYFYKNMKAGI